MDAALAAVCTLVVSWPVTELFQSQPWVGPLVLALAVVAATGALARAGGLRAGGVLALQVAVAGLVVCWQLFPGAYLWYGLPRPAVLPELARLGAQAVRTIEMETVPVPANAGMVLLTVVGLAAVGIAVDALAVTARSPALAGLPLLAVAVVSASSTGTAQHPRYFLAAAVAWLVLLARQAIGRLGDWPGAARDGAGGPARRAAPAVEAAAAGSVRRYRSWARLVGAVAVLAAAAAPALVPHLPTTSLLDGLGRGGSGTSFTRTLDLAEDLGSRSTALVLRFRTDDPRPVPLRVTVTDRYAEGRWHPGDGAAVGPAEPTGPASPAVPVERYQVEVETNEVRAPQIALPAPLLRADLGGPDLLLDAAGAGVVGEQPAAYRASYWRPGGALPPGVGAGTGHDPADPALAVDPASAEVVVPLAAELTAGATNEVQAAMAIQAYLRSSIFTYSLTLAEEVPGPDGAPLDPVSHFLQTRQGYCTQFATAMVMLARAAGIPARLAVGFLPGEVQPDGSHLVVAADAHAWPELDIAGLGWTRFEPTPGGRSGPAPLYFAPAGATGPATAPTPAPGATAPAPVDDATNPVIGDTGAVGWWAAAARLRPLGLALLVVVALLAVVPAVGWSRRTAGRRRARDEADRVEAEWGVLVAGLADLGVTAPPAATPRQARARYAEAAGLDPPALAALGRAADRLERTRYAPAGPEAEGMAQDVRAVLRRARRGARWPARVAAALWPRSGTEPLRGLLRRARRRARWERAA
ncbi:transglutaminaseTgpA domain-containing protein [Georgenia sp. TF02-10]|uniref:transglutaminase family protein n=1 Tax=Georgenia sp. TF02-10 TaxID=2917725 RepID=UPI001FA7501F|nr:transglutaminaseTgpA domain-containing protein [Georgenia sp. TF02-10]UNX56257.1 transglutaminaseTgpA domain-containing protein [Georgenia sp. TF02-10]